MKPHRTIRGTAWHQQRPPSRGAGGGNRAARRAASAPLGVWTHLTAQWDAATGEQRVWVNGALDTADQEMP